MPKQVIEPPFSLDQSLDNWVNGQSAFKIPSKEVEILKKQFYPPILAVENFFARRKIRLLVAKARGYVLDREGNSVPPNPTPISGAR